MKAIFGGGSGLHPDCKESLYCDLGGIDCWDIAGDVLVKGKCTWITVGGSGGMKGDHCVCVV